MTDPDPNTLKSAAAYLVQVARSTQGGRYRKQPKIDALSEYKGEILEAHRSGISIHRIAQIFRERGVDISTIHLMRTIRRFIDEEERARVGASTGQRPPSTKEPKSEATYQVSEQPSALVQEQEFAKQLRLARYLAAASLPPSRALEPVRQRRTSKQKRPIAKAGGKTKGESARQKAGEAELAKERRRAGQVGRHKASSSGSGRSEKQRSGPSR